METNEMHYNVVDAISAYENGELDADSIIELFQHLLDSGLVWHLQGHYGRFANILIQNGDIVKR